MATLLATVTPAETQGEAMGRYLQGVRPLLIAGGGKLVKQARVVNTIKGDQGTVMVMVMDFDSAETINAIFASDAYQALVPDRDLGFSHVEILVAEDIH